MSSDPLLSKEEREERRQRVSEIAFRVEAWPMQAQKDLRYMLAALRSSEAALSEARKDAERLGDALNWVTHLYHGVGRSGASPEPSEWEAAIDEAKAALAARSLPEKPEPATPTTGHEK